MAAGIGYAILSSSILVLIPLSIVGGMIWGPFLAGLYDGILRGLRDAPESWWTAWRKSLRQNGRESLLPGAVLGLLIGMYAFMAALFWWSAAPQSVLFRQTALNRMRNIILFTAKYAWRMAGIAVLQLIYAMIYVLFAPWTLLLVPVLGFWYITFLSQFFIYEPLNKELEIEEKFKTSSL